PAGLGVQAPAGRDALLKHLSDVLPVEPGTLARKLGLPVAEVLSRLTALEMAGAARRRGSGFLRLTR
ncbi:MAG: hypothetical protein ABI838_10585, partial [Chloroflexota bacterium]